MQFTEDRAKRNPKESDHDVDKAFEYYINSKIKLIHVQSSANTIFP